MSDSLRPTVCVIVPCYNEQEVLDEFFRRSVSVAAQTPGWNFTWLFVDDCSIDDTPSILSTLAASDARVQVIRLARNRGHQVAVTAGLDYADADAVVIIDADLQDPPETIGQMLALIEQGFDVVHAQRRRRAGESWFKLATASMFYRLLGRLSKTQIIPDSGDFRAISRRVLEAARGFREPHRFLRGLFAAIGFRQVIMPYDRHERFAGKSKYPLRKMLRLAMDALFSFSAAPIRAIVVASLVMWTMALIYLVHTIIVWAQGLTQPGWPSIVILMTFYTGLILLSVAIVGAYVGRVFEQGQQRPLYWLESAQNVPLDSLRARPQLDRELRISQSILTLRQLPCPEDPKSTHDRPEIVVRPTIDLPHPAGSLKQPQSASSRRYAPPDGDTTSSES